MTTYFRTHQEEILNDFKKFLSFKSISADKSLKDELLATADWLKNYLENIGFECELWPTKTYPTLFAHYSKKKDKKTILIYNHYDVQPVDPLSKWDSDPFDAQIKDGLIFARGAQDNKGQCFYVITALKAYLKTFGELPVNVKLCIEGDEEIGSEGLKEVAPFKQDELKADDLWVVDLGILNEDKPAITLGTRGLTALEVTLNTTDHDLHSGEHGGIVLNPIVELCHLLAKLHDEESNRVMVPQFYDHIEELSDEELKALDLHLDEKEYEKNFGAKPIGGEIQYQPLERAWLRPTLEINGIKGGYIGEGVKTVIPQSASAKITCRLVKGQNPYYIQAYISEFLQKEVKKGVKLHIQILNPGSFAMRTKPQSNSAKVVANSFSEIFGKKCSFIMAGGTIGIVEILSQSAQAEVLFFGLGLPTDNIHAPNEHFSIERLEKGAAIIATALDMS